MGPTGTGKSTLVSLLLRFWEYEQGSISLTSGTRSPVELRSLPGDEARRIFSVMPQSPHLFHASLRENLALALPEGREKDDAAMKDALAAVRLTSLVATFTDGLETMVGEKGRELSVGETRRVALARALLKDAPIYILDEPTEGLDEETAESVLAAVDARLRGRTLIIISHRPRDLSIADTVAHMRA